MQSFYILFIYVNNMYNTTCFIYTFLILTNITLKGKDMEKEKKKKTSNARTTVCLDKALKEKTEEKFKSTYGISLSSGLALLMTALIEEKIQIFK